MHTCTLTYLLTLLSAKKKKVGRRKKGDDTDMHDLRSPFLISCVCLKGKIDPVKLLCHTKALVVVENSAAKILLATIEFLKLLFCK